MSSKNRDKYTVKTEGPYKALETSCSEDVVTVNFEFFDDQMFYCDTFSKITIINFVAKSYAESCLTLLRKVNDYQLDNTISSIYFSTRRFLPAMFCFRHYLELRLKCIYMEIHLKSFDTTHDLISLYNDIKDYNPDLKVFEEPINYVNQFENGYDEFFRYLISKNFIGCKSLNMPMHDFKKVKNYITSIEICVKNVIDKLMESRSEL